MAGAVEAQRPPRRTIPVAVKRAVIARQWGVCHGDRCYAGVDSKPGSNTHFDHAWALRLRDINADGTDYVPHQHDDRYIDALCPPCHHAKTHGTGATTAGTDIGKIKKERKAGRPGKPKRKMQGRGFPPKGSRPMRSKK